MKTSQDPVRDYLSAVEGEASALPADRRQELLADLAEHIEVTRAERPGTAIGEVLAELGDPRTIAATALAESGGGAAPARSGAGAPARRGKVHPLVPLLMLTLALPLGMVFSNEQGSLVGGLLRAVGAVLLCTSVHWAGVGKLAGVLLAAVLPGAAIAAWNLSDSGPMGDVPFVLANLAAFVLVTGTAAWLWLVRRA